MKFTNILASTILLTVTGFTLLAQRPDSTYNKACYYYDNEEYTLAIPLYSEFLKNIHGDFNSLFYRGNCYMETGQTKLAIKDFKEAYSLKNNDSKLLYSLGVAYDMAMVPDSAIYFFKKFVHLEPKQSVGYARLSILFMNFHPEWADSAIFYAGKAVNAEPENPMNFNFLALAYYSKNEFQTALESALRGLAIDSSISELNRIAGISSFFLEEYFKAIEFFDRAYMANPDDLSLMDFKIQSILVQNTQKEKISIPVNGKISFTGISSENIKKLKSNCKPGEPYSYSQLVTKLNSDPFKFSLDEFFMLYLGATYQEGYSPFKKPLPDKNPVNDPLKKIIGTEQLLLLNPTDFPLYLSLADMYLSLGEEVKYFENRYKYIGFIESIKATGNGVSPATAYIICDAGHEFEIMAALGYEIKNQSLVKEKGHTFHRTTGTDEYYNEVILYFNIDQLVSFLPKKGKQ